jgi:phage terminase small subunit
MFIPDKKVSELLLPPDELVELFEVTPAEARFVTLYVVHPTSAKRAVEEAGFSKTRSTQTATYLLRKPNVAAAIAYEMQKLQERTRITQEQILNELAIVAFSNVNDFVVDEDGNLGLRPGVPEYMMRAVKGVKRHTRRVKEGKNWVEYVDVEIQLWGKMEALQLAGKHFGMYRENINVRAELEVKTSQTWQFGGKSITFQ